MIFTKVINSRKYNSGAHYLSLGEYLMLSERCISRFAPTYLKRMMLKSEDAISFVAEYIIMGSSKFDENKGRQFKSYLNQCAIWGIRKWIHLNKMRPNKIISLNISKDEESGELSDTIADKIPQTYELDNIFKRAGLTKKEADMVLCVIIEEEKVKDIANQFNMTPQAVCCFVKKGLNKIKTVYEEEFSQESSDR